MENDSKEITLPVAGMTCSSCAAHIERALGALPGVAGAAVNLATERATVRFANGQVETDELVAAVRSAGYDVPTETAELPIGGMTCASCAAHVEGALADVPGVVRAAVNLATERATVEYIPGAAALADLKRAVSEAGYRVLEPETAAEAEPADQDAAKMAAARSRAQRSRPRLPDRGRAPAAGGGAVTGTGGRPGHPDGCPEPVAPGGGRRQLIMKGVRMSSSPSLSGREQPNVLGATQGVIRLSAADRFTHWFGRYWLLVFSLAYGFFVGLPFLAPVLMQIGWEAPGRVIYFIYTFLCHQLPQRSFFLFGPQGMYELSTIQAAWENTLNPLVLRQFIGNPGMGWKVAWSDRMVSMYTSILVVAWLWYPLRKRIKALPLWGFVLFTLPIFVDGSTHLLSDLAGIGQGFRDSNTWLAALTGDAFSPGFYAGDALGSFNSWMRLLTGTLFGLGIVWYGFPYIEETARLARLKIEHTMQMSQYLKERLHDTGNDDQT
jgi:copper ion binding protein